ncbi:MAG: transporter substrate-binding domain-containing protein [Pseudomonadota bacterium]
MTLRPLFVLALLASSANACVIRLAYNEIAAPPYYFGDGGKTPENPGPAIELVDLAAAKLGCKMLWQRKPLKRILRELETNDIDATLALSYSKDRAATMVYPMKNSTPDASLALWTLSYDFYVKRGSTLKWDGKNFNRTPQRVGANAGYSVIKDLTELGIKVEEAQGDVNNLGKLVNDRIEVYAGQGLFVDQLRTQAEFKGIEKLPPSIVRKDYFLVFSNGFYATSGDTAQKLWKQIEEVKKSHGAALDKKYQALSGNTIAIF